MSRFDPKPFSARPRSFSWSYSKLKNYESCPKRHYHADIAKDFKDELGENLAWGKAAHDYIAKSINGELALPSGFTQFQPWVDKVLKGTENPEIKVYAELKLAITEDFQPCEWTSNKAWFRGIIDVFKEAGAAGLLLDWKAGKILEDSVQLALFAQLVFSHYAHIQKIRTEFVWLKHEATTREDFNRKDMQELWAALMPRVDALKAASVNADYPAKPGFLCRRYCPVRPCAHYGA